MSSIVRVLSLFAFCTVAACSAAEPDDATTGDDEINTRRASEGQSCSNGTFGTPLTSCASGLVCDFGKGTAPAGPDGASSAKTGTCKKPRAKLGESCSEGVFGTPNIACDDGLVCTYPEDNTKPSGPTGGSSARTGRCTEAEPSSGLLACELEIAFSCPAGSFDGCLEPGLTKGHVCVAGSR